MGFQNERFEVIRQLREGILSDTEASIARIQQIMLDVAVPPRPDAAVPPRPDAAKPPRSDAGGPS